jgi:hypothetical protein
MMLWRCFLRYVNSTTIFVSQPKYNAAFRNDVVVYLWNVCCTYAPYYIPHSEPHSKSQFDLEWGTSFVTPNFLNDLPET